MKCTLYTLHAGICGIVLAQAFVFMPHSCCRLLVDAGLHNVITKNLTAYSLYQQVVRSYWSMTARLEPDCFVQPENTEQVSLALKALNDESKCQFGVRSGGHSSIRGWNNIEDGVTIDLSRLKSMLYDRRSNVLSIGPGLHWQSVYEYAEWHGIMVPGARLGAVGVGGLLCGGGLSYHMHEKGLAMDSVKKYEVVLANGTIIEASPDSNADLWLALKGTQCNFAIVTRFDLEAFPNPKFWGGVLSYSNTVETTSKFITTLKNFTDNIENYLPGTAWVYWGHNGADLEPKDTIWTGLVDTSGAANSSAYEHFTSIPGKLIGELAPTKTSLLTGFSRPGNYSNIWMTCSFVNNERLMHKAVKLHQQMVNTYGKQFGLDSDYTTQVLFQPLPVAIGRASAKMGGNITPLAEQKVNGQVLYGSIAVRDVTRESFAREVLMDLKRKFCDALTKEERIDYEYINYADGTQNPIKRYGKANIDRLLAAEKKYDPTLVFRRRVPGGFNIPSSPPSNNVKSGLEGLY